MCAAVASSGAVRVFAHARGNVYMRELAALLVAEMKRCGVRASVVTQGRPGGSGSLDVVVAPHEYAAFEPSMVGERGQDVMTRCAAVTTEQPGTVWFETSRWICQYCPVIVDVNEVSAKLLVAHGMPVEPIRFGYTPFWDRWGGHDAAPRATDVTLLAAITPHRDSVLSAASGVLAEHRSRVLLFDNSRPVVESDDWFVGGEELWGLLADSRVLLNVRRDARRGYFEWIRCLPALLNGAVVVTEPSAGAEPMVPFEHFLPVGATTLGAHLTALLDDEARRAAMAQAAYETLRSGPPLADAVRRFVERAGDALGTSASPAPASGQAPHDPPPRRQPPTIPGTRPRDDLDELVTEVVLDDAELAGAADLSSLQRRIEGAPAPLVLVRAAGDHLAPRGLAALVEVLEPGGAGDSAVASYGVTVTHDHRLVNHLPWDPSRLCASPFITAPVLVRRDAFGSALREAAAVLSRRPDLPPAWTWHVPWIVIAARGLRAHHVGAIIAWSSRRADRSPAPNELRASFPSLPWPDASTAEPAPSETEAA